LPDGKWSGQYAIEESCARKDMSKYFADEPVWFTPTDEMRSWNGKDIWIRQGKRECNRPILNVLKG